MKCDERNCWGCAWRAIIGPVDDPTLCCGHTSHQVRNSFAGYTTAENCKAYLRDDPGLKIKVKRDTREMLMKGIHQKVVDNGQFQSAEAILDYFSPDTYDSPKEITCDDFDVVTEVQFGGSEGIYPERGQGGNNRYRGNCSPKLIEDLIAHFRPHEVCDYMCGSNTTADAARTMGIVSHTYDLHSGFDLLHTDIKERPEFIFWHPPYGQL